MHIYSGKNKPDNRLYKIYFIDHSYTPHLPRSVQYELQFCKGFLENEFRFTMQ